MRNVLAIAKKELVVYLTTPLAYLMFTGMAFISSIFFLLFVATFKQAHEAAARFGWEALGPDAQPLRNLTDGVVVGLFSSVLFITIMVAPFLSMRLIAEEKRQKTFEFLMTAPIRSWDIVLGKYLGGVGIMVCTLGVTVVYPLILAKFGASESGSALEWSTVGLGYLALFLWGATCMAVGLFVSSVTDSQLIAGLLSLAGLLVWTFVQGFAPQVDEPWHTLLGSISFIEQLQPLLKGVLAVKPLVFFSSVIALFLLLTHRSVEAQRWT